MIDDGDWLVEANYGRLTHAADQVPLFDIVSRSIDKQQVKSYRRCKCVAQTEGNVCFCSPPISDDGEEKHDDISSRQLV